MQRLRVKFKRGEELKFISHLDITRLWQRALKRAGVAIAYSEGFSPHPRISLAAPLALGVTGEAELMDVVLDKPMSPHSFSAVVGRQLPRGMEIVQVFQMVLLTPSLQSLVRFAEYSVAVETAKSQQEVESAISSLLARDQIPWEHQRDTGPKRYDLRTLIDDIWLLEWREGCPRLGMRLRCDGGGSGRPEQVTSALGLGTYPAAMHRTRLVLETV